MSGDDETSPKEGQGSVKLATSFWLTDLLIWFAQVEEQFSI